MSNTYSDVAIVIQCVSERNVALFQVFKFLSFFTLFRNQIKFQKVWKVLPVVWTLFVPVTFVTFELS